MKSPDQMTDWELTATEARMQSLMTARNERLKEAKKRHEKINFTNFEFLHMRAAIDNELNNRRSK